MKNLGLSWIRNQARERDALPLSIKQCFPHPVCTLSCNPQMQMQFSPLYRGGNQELLRTCQSYRAMGCKAGIESLGSPPPATHDTMILGSSRDWEMGVWSALKGWLGSYIKASGRRGNGLGAWWTQGPAWHRGRRGGGVFKGRLEQRF